MSMKIENNKLKNARQERSDSGLYSGQTIAGTVAKSAALTLKKRQANNNNNTREEEQAKRTKKRRPTKVALNDTLRRIRHLIVEGSSNAEIQNILQLEERTFYRYMAKIYQIDQALFEEQEKKTITTETGIFKDRLLKSYRWYIAIADDEDIKVDIRMEAQRNAVEMALALLKLELECPRIISNASMELQI
jgi:DNA-binding CsgD family transcriptional regulator